MYRMSAKKLTIEVLILVGNINNVSNLFLPEVYPSESHK